MQPTPFDGTSQPFTIGLKPLDLAQWLDRDATFDAQLAEKRRLYRELPDEVFVEEADTRAAQTEVLDLIRTATAERGEDSANDATLALFGADPPPLVAASLRVQEDLIIMRRGDNGWRLAAGSLCFPSSWTLTEKFGRPLQDIHAPVPGFGAGTRNHELIERMFDRLHQPVLRYNWSVQAGDALYHPLSNDGRNERANARAVRFGDREINASAFIRLFTIRIYLDPLGWLGQSPDRATIAPAFAAQLMALDEAQLDYKGLTADRDRLVAALVGISQS